LTLKISALFQNNISRLPAGGDRRAGLWKIVCDTQMFFRSIMIGEFSVNFTQEREILLNFSKISDILYKTRQNAKICVTERSNYEHKRQANIARFGGALL
jgi:hypothetical protein